MSFLELENSKNYLNLIGVDEVGRGPIAGPVIACGVGYSGSKKDLLSKLEYLKGLKVTDSKKLTQLKRNLILKSVFNGESFDYKKFNYLKKYEFSSTISGFSFCLQAKGPDEIVNLNILWASMEAMGECASVISQDKKYDIWVDGNRLPKNLPSHNEAKAIIKGDEKSIIIGLASIVAKQFRDQLMGDYHNTFPEFDFKKNAGYPTPAHKKALGIYGKTKIHRESFKTVKETLKVYGVK